MASNNVWKLANRLEEEFGVVVDVETFHRTRAGRHLMCSGAYSWIIAVKEFQGRKISGWLGGCEALSKYVSKEHKLQLNSAIEHDMELYYLPISEKEYDNAMDAAFEIINGK